VGLTVIAVVAKNSGVSQARDDCRSQQPMRDDCSSGFALSGVLGLPGRRLRPEPVTRNSAAYAARRPIG
jgi:hypothetical protein